MSVQYPVASETVSKPKGVAGFVLGGLAFIPLLGIGFGAGAIVIGLVRKQRVAVILGVAGILSTVILYGSLFYFGFAKRGGVYDELRSKMAVTMLAGAVREVEYYKQVHGYYPKALKDLSAQTKQGMPVLFDPTAMERKGSPDSYFYYELTRDGNKYYLRSVGPDGIAFTDDDFVPDVPLEERAKLGLLLKRDEG